MEFSEKIFPDQKNQFLPCFLMIFGSWARLGLGIPPPGASEAQRHCGPAAEPGESAGRPRDPATPPTLPVVSGVARGSFARLPGPPGRPHPAGNLLSLFLKMYY